MALEVEAPFARVNLCERVAMRGRQNPRRVLELFDQLVPDLHTVPDIDSHVRTFIPEILVFLGRYEEATELAGKLLERARRVGDLACGSMLQSAMALAALGEGDVDRARAFARDTCERARAVAMPMAPAAADFYAGLVEFGAGEVETADAIWRRIDVPVLSHIASLGQAALLHARGEHDGADDALHDFISAVWSGAISNSALVDIALKLLASIAVARGAPVEAARILGALAGDHERTGFTPYAEPPGIAPADQAEAALGSDDYRRAFEEGQTLSIEDLLAFIRRGRGERRRPTSGWASLTPTEMQVVDLLSEGHSNRAIAERLLMSVRTVTTHLSHVYTKLDLTSRTELVAAVHRRT